jgi:hypothetical protein
MTTPAGPSLVTRLRLLVDSFVQPAKQADASYKQLVGNIQAGAQKVQAAGKTFDAFGSRVGNILAGGAVLGGVGLLGSALVGFATDADRADKSAAAFDRTLTRFGQSTGEGAALVKTLGERFGVTDSIIQQAGTTLIRNGASLDLVNKALTAAGASALAQGTSVATAMENVAVAIATGHSELLESSGIITNLGPILQAYAKSVKKTVEELTPQEKVLAAVNAIHKESRFEIEEVDNAMQGLAGANARYSRALTEVRNEIGRGLIPTLTSLLGAALPVLRWFGDLIQDGPRVNAIFRTAATSAALFGAALVGVQVKALAASVALNGGLIPAITAFIARNALLTGIATPWLAAGVAIVALTNYIAALNDQISDIEQKTLDSGIATDQSILKQIKAYKALNTEIGDLKAQALSLVIRLGDSQDAGERERLKKQIADIRGEIGRLEAAQAKQAKAPKVTPASQKELEEAAKTFREFREQIAKLEFDVLPEGTAKDIAEVRREFHGLRAEIQAAAKENPTGFGPKAAGLITRANKAEADAVRKIQDEARREREEKEREHADTVAGIIRDRQDAIAGLTESALTTEAARTNAHYAQARKELDRKLAEDLQAVGDDAQARLQVQDLYNREVILLDRERNRILTEAAAVRRREAIQAAQDLARTLQDNELETATILAGLTKGRRDDELAAYEQRRVQAVRYYKDQIELARKAGLDVTALEEQRDARIEAIRREHVANLTQIDRETQTDAVRQRVETLTANLAKLSANGSRDLLRLLQAMRSTMTGNKDALAILDPAITSVKGRLIDLQRTAEETARAAREKAIKASVELARTIQDAQAENASLAASLSESRRDDEEASYAARQQATARFFKDEIARYRAQGLSTVKLEQERDRRIELERQQHLANLARIDSEGQAESVSKVVATVTRDLDNLNEVGARKLLDFLNSMRAAASGNAEALKVIDDAIANTIGRLGDLKDAAAEAQADAARTIASNFRELASQRASLTEDQFDDIAADLAGTLAGIDEALASSLEKQGITETQRTTLIAQAAEARNNAIIKATRDTVDLEARLQAESVAERVEALTEGLDRMDAAQAASAGVQLRAMLDLAQGNKAAVASINAGLDSARARYISLGTTAHAEAQKLIEDARSLSRALDQEGAGEGTQLDALFQQAGERAAEAGRMVARLTQALAGADADTGAIMRGLIASINAGAKGVQAATLRAADRIVEQAAQQYEDALAEAARSAGQAALKGVPEAIDDVLSRVDDLSADALLDAATRLNDLYGALADAGFPREALDALEERFNRIGDLQASLAARTADFKITQLEAARDIAAAVLDEAAARDFLRGSLEAEIAVRRTELERLRASGAGTTVLADANRKLAASGLNLIGVLTDQVTALHAQRAAVEGSLDTVARFAGLLNKPLPDTVIAGYKTLSESWLAVGNAALAAGNIAEANDALAKGADYAEKYAAAVDSKLIKSYDRLYKNLTKNPRSFDGAAVMEFAKQLAAEYEVTVPEAYELVLNNVRKGISELDPANLVRRAVQGVTDASEDAMEEGAKVSRRAVAGVEEAFESLEGAAGKLPATIESVDASIASLTSELEALKANLAAAIDFQSFGTQFATALTTGVQSADPEVVAYFKGLGSRLITALQDGIATARATLRRELEEAVGPDIAATIVSLVTGAAGGVRVAVQAVTSGLTASLTAAESLATRALAEADRVDAALKKSADTLADRLGVAFDKFIADLRGTSVNVAATSVTAPTTGTQVTTGRAPDIITNNITNVKLTFSISELEGFPALTEIGRTVEPLINERVRREITRLTEINRQKNLGKEEC